MAIETGVVKAGPTKPFFVSMLTRDIALADAILDLIDNCIDGVVRQLRATASSPDDERPYEGYWARITISPDTFEIVDNCGGIPREIAKESAFMLGRPTLQQDADIETIGMYGIGMKRAIFKMGRACTVTSQPTSRPYVVTISPEWLDDDDNWMLPLQEANERLEENGTRIQVTDLYEGIRRQFDESQSSFVKHLRREISELYAIIIKKGFVVELNGTPVDPIQLMLLFPKRVSPRNGAAIAPFLFTAQLDSVDVNLCVGFYRPLATEQELEEEKEVRRSRDNAGWTVVCNDRVVLHADKTRVTGWGTSNVPSYHNQFISIAGVVFFKSKNSLALPLNTTKRGLDTSSDVYLAILDVMREGMKKFTDFTNKWKGREPETMAAFDETVSREAATLITSLPQASWGTSRKLARATDAKKYSPDLPMPQDKDPTRRISFARPDSEVRAASRALFGRDDVKPSDVGQRAFDNVLEAHDGGR